MYPIRSGATQPSRILRRLKAISWWAAMHKRRARILILLLYIPFSGLALLLNVQLLTLGVHLPLWAGAITLAVAILACTVYPRRQLYSQRDHYMRRKLSQMLLSAATFCTIVWMFNANVIAVDRWISPVFGSMRYTIKQPRQEEHTNTATLTSASTGNCLVQRLAHLRQWHSEQQTWVKVLLTVLTCLIATAVFMLLAVASCLIICEGAAFLGVALFILGGAGIVVGTIALVRKIWDMGPGRRRSRYSY